MTVLLHSRREFSSRRWRQLQSLREGTLGSSFRFSNDSLASVERTRKQLLVQVVLVCSLSPAFLASRGTSTAAAAAGEREGERDDPFLLRESATPSTAALHSQLPWCEQRHRQSRGKQRVDRKLTSHDCSRRREQKGRHTRAIE